MKRVGFFIICLLGAAPARAGNLLVEVKVSTAIVERNPVSDGNSFSVNTAQLVGWSRIKGATEPIEIYHRWRWEGKNQALVELPVRSSNYRVWSYLEPGGKKGSWTLDIMDSAKNVLTSKAFEIR